jgi:hypothetical protein
MKKFFLLTIQVILIIFMVPALFINNDGRVYSQTNTIEDINELQQEALAEVEAELQRAKDDLTARKNQEINIVDSSKATERTKEKMKTKIENKYLELEKQLVAKTSARKQDIINYYEHMKKELSVQEKKAVKKTIFIPPQKLIGKWFLVGFHFLGTLKFSSNKGVLVANIQTYKYNKWEDLYNLTYDGHNIAFDYENPYGTNLHFEGTVEPTDEPDARHIKGKLIDLNTNKEYSWKAYR